MQSEHLKPKHYCQGKVECIEALRSALSKEEFIGFCKGNIMKYLWRVNHKGGLDDLLKAQIYMNWLIEAYTEKD